MSALKLNKQLIHSLFSSIRFNMLLFYIKYINIKDIIVFYIYNVVVF